MDSQALNALPTHPTLLHPRTGDPLRAVGILPNGRVVWPIMGGDGSESDANDSGNDDGADDNGDQGGDDQGDQGDSEDKGRASRQAARYRTQLRETQTQLTELQTAHEQTQQILQGIRGVLDPEGNSNDGGDPAEQVTELTGRVQSLTDRNAELERDLLVYELAMDQARGLNANPVALLDSQRFRRSLSELDAESDKYRDDVAEAIKDAVSKNAAYRAGQGSSSGGSDLNGGREKTKSRPRDLRSALTGVYGG